MIKIAGIPVSFHPLFVIIMLTSVFTGHFAELIVLFGIVFVHELGHAAAARMLGLNVLSIQLLPFGGVAVVEEDGRLNARKEIWIAAAGPLQNIILAGLGLLLHVVGIWNGPSLTYFIEANLLIVLFNLLPILPLDGGKIGQAFFSLFLPYHTTLLWAVRISIVFSGLLIAYSFYPLLYDRGVQLNLLMVGLFLFYSNWVDHGNIPFRFIRFLISRQRLFSDSKPSAKNAQPLVADSAKPLDTILRLLRREKYHFVYVVNAKGELLDIVPEQKMIDLFLTGLAINHGK
ncbi:M50 family metallopeptidase [Paenibacillus physcomitrellae]|uniref:Stage IV sporulation protein FB n=1 Tax=Paenibacillus physcomitrellae TaxID=1619311 RepID=A0ABQ1G5J8_9BACL|nr:M50 family metallopeptidase [Paenibacillus physcomitrellae]GGA36615.1 stage IV sporulation protein FB [Paenibacillus physcomitrellae]